MEEVWWPISWLNFYEISNYGRIRSIDRYVSGWNSPKFRKGALLKPRKKNDGYYDIGLWVDGKKKHFSVHRLLAEVFIPNPLNLPCVNHKNEFNKTDNFVWVNSDGTVDTEKSSIEWCTYKENTNYGTCIERRSNTRKMQGNRDGNIVVYKNGEYYGTYPSIRSAARDLGFYESIISKKILGSIKKEDYKGFTFKREI